MRTRSAFLLPVLLAVACSSGESHENQVQWSSDEAPSYFVVVSPADGFVPACAAIDQGKTVQWENLVPQIPANVTSVDDPAELYSPNLQGEYVTWAHTFDETGYFEYYDTNSGDPGRRIVDSYYGTVEYVGVSETTQRGAICVQTDGDTLGACCCSNFDCDLSTQTCVANTCVANP